MANSAYSTFGSERYGRTAAEIEASYKSDASVYIADKTLSVAMKNCVLKQYGMQATLPSGSSRTFQFTRFNRMASPRSPLTDGTSPTATAMSITTKLAVMDQWGATCIITDQAQLSIKHGPLPKAVELMGLMAAETVDREIFEVLMGGTGILFPGTVTARGSLATTDVITSDVIGKAKAVLGDLGAQTYDGMHYIGVCDTYVEQDIRKDTTFTNAASYSAIRKLENAEVGIWMGVRWVASNVLYSLRRLEATSDVGVDSSTLDATGGTGTLNATYYWKIEAVDAVTGAVREVSPENNISPSNSDITITMPSSTSYVYNLYVGSVSGTLYLHSAFNAAAAAVVLDAAGDIPTSGDSPAATPNTGVKVHFSFIIGKEAYAVPELLNLQTYVVYASASDSDPLAQRNTVGWKTDFKAVICNNDYMRRIESESAFD